MAFFSKVLDIWYTVLAGPDGVEAALAGTATLSGELPLPWRTCTCNLVSVSEFSVQPRTNGIPLCFGHPRRACLSLLLILRPAVQTW